MTSHVSAYVNQVCSKADPDRPSRREFDLAVLFLLAEANGFDTKRFRDAIKNPYARGRVRMNIGNLLRGKFMREGFIFTLDNKRLTTTH